jgi:uncharacterized membrane protein YphA (DoxX/SURF4 family)
MYKKTVKLFLRFGIGVGFLSAVADRLGLWPEAISAWGNWDSFLDYTAVINPWVPEIIIPTIGFIATLAEALFGLCLLLGFKTELVAKLSGYLMLIFALAITFSLGIKGAFDYSVFAASGAAFALGLLSDKYLELDLLLFKKK